jgi:hypothetical protein
MFLRGKRFLAGRIPRVGIKGQGPRKADSTETIPDFYRMTSLPPLETATANIASLVTHGPISAHVRALQSSSADTRLANSRTELTTVNSPSNATSASVALISQAPSSSFLNGPVVNGSSLWSCLDSTNPHWAAAALNSAGLRHGAAPVAPPSAPLTADQSFLLQVIANRRLADAAAAGNAFWLEQQQQQQQQQALLSELYPNSPRYPNGWPGWLDPRNARQWP